MKTFKQTLSLFAAIVAAGALLAGCATINQAKEMPPRVEAANAAFGPGFDYMIVERGNVVTDTVFIGLFDTPFVSDLSRELYIRMVQAEATGKRFMVTGENAAKTAQVTIEALFRAEDDSLPNLELLYLGEEQYVPGIEDAVKRVGGKMRFAPYSG